MTIVSTIIHTISLEAIIGLDSYSASEWDRSRTLSRTELEYLQSAWKYLAYPPLTQANEVETIVWTQLLQRGDGANVVGEMSWQLWLQRLANGLLEEENFGRIRKLISFNMLGEPTCTISDKQLAVAWGEMREKTEVSHYLGALLATLRRYSDRYLP